MKNHAIVCEALTTYPLLDKGKTVLTLSVYSQNVATLIL